MRSNTLIFTLLLLALALSCKEKASESGNPQQDSEDAGIITLSPQQFEANNMAVSTPEEMRFPEVIRVSGMIDVPPENRVVISAVYGGFVKKTSLLVGDKVRKGQVVAVLENPEFLTLQQEYMEVRETLPYLKSEFERQQTLFEEQISSEKGFLQAKSAYRSASARKSGLEKQLSLLGIRPDELEPDALRSEIALYAPISGKVTQVNISMGSYVSRASEMLEIINPEHLHLELSVFEQDIGKVREGQPIRFRIPEVSDTQYEGAVYLVGSSIDVGRTVKVHGHLNEEHKASLLVGMFVQAEIQVGTDEDPEAESPLFLALPEEAIIAQDEERFIFVQEGTSDAGLRFRKVMVKTGPTAQGMTALTDAGSLSSSDKVLVNGAFLISGMEP
jgi:cobalt-zinc-cadmium efflux system membrane fusion protein